MWKYEDYSTPELFELSWEVTTGDRSLIVKDYVLAHDISEANKISRARELEYNLWLACADYDTIVKILPNIEHDYEGDVPELSDELLQEWKEDAACEGMYYKQSGCHEVRYMRYAGRRYEIQLVRAAPGSAAKAVGKAIDDAVSLKLEANNESNRS